METQSTSSLEARIKLAMERITQLRDICSVPSISVGILHYGEVIHMESRGFRDVEESLPANPDTIYLLSSLSKGFLSAAVGVAVSEGKMAWKTPLSHYIPEFKHPDPAVREKANLIDFLRHSTGLSSPQLLVLGPRGTLIHPEKDFVQLMNTSPTCDENGSRHNRWWSYDNWGYGLVAVALERVYQQHYEDILRQKFLSSLNLSRTVVDSSELRQDSNIAYPYVVLDNGTFHRSTSDNWTYQNHRPANAALGMRSCVRDMLSWALCVLESEKREQEGRGDFNHKERQLWTFPNASQTRKGRWTRPWPGKSPINDTTAYCMGWYKTTIPSQMLGFLSYNDMTREEKEQSDDTDFDSVLGMESCKRELVAHNGVFFGSTSALYTFPETQSAIIVFANGLQDADAAEFAAQILMQAMFDLRPEVDVLALARRESHLRKQHFTSCVLSNFETNRDTNADESPRQQYIGHFWGHATKLSILQDHRTTELYIKFNGVENSILALRHYGKDMYTFFPSSRDEWLVNDMFEWNSHGLALLEFRRNIDFIVVGLYWRWNFEGEPSWFEKGLGESVISI